MKIIISVIIFLSLMRVFVWAYKFKKKEMKLIDLFWSAVWSATPGGIILLIF